MTQTRTTLCNRDCPDVCRIVAEVEENRVVHIKGDPTHPITRGFLCHRTNQFLTTQYSPDRLTSPLLKRNGQFTPVDWETALDFAARQLNRVKEKYGAEAIFHYRSGGSLGMLKSLTDYFFRHFGPVTVKRGDICSGASEAAQELDFGVSDSNDVYDLLNARHVLIWGKNVATSSPHTLRILKDAAARGTELTLIDPVYHQSARICHRVIQPRPASDYALAMAVARTLIERDWIVKNATDYCDNVAEFKSLAMTQSVQAWSEQADVLPSVALELAEKLVNGPTTILVGWGMGRRLNGATITRALDALAALTGNLGKPGAGVSFYFRRRGAYDSSWIAGDTTPPRTISEPLFGPGILEASDPPIKAVWVTAGNPVVMLPESRTSVRALEQCDFVVVVDSFLTDTAQLADLVLPTTTLLEDDDLLGAYGHHWLGASSPVISPPPLVKSDLQIIQGLAERLELGTLMEGTARDWKQRYVGKALQEHGVELSDLEADVVRNPLAPEILFADLQFPTPSGKVNLMTEAEAQPEPPDSKYPLFLMSLSTKHSQSSQWAKKTADLMTVTVHPTAANGLEDGALARLESTIASMTVRIKYDDNQRHDVAIIPKGGHLSKGHCANALVRARTTDLGEGGALYDERVRLLPLDT